jgi:membrane associated rhomboid family serine protease
MIVLPAGHAPRRPWATVALVLLHVAAFAYTAWEGSRADAELLRAIERAREVHERYPAARIAPELMETAPERARELFAGWTRREDDRPSAPMSEGDAALSTAMEGVLSALEHTPAHRFGYRTAKPSARAFASSLFVHADMWHLFGNLLFLWLAGSALEGLWKRYAVVLLYALAHAAGILAHHAAAPGSMTPLVGASAAVCGLLGALVVAHPSARIAWIPAWVLVPLFASVQIAWGLLALGETTAHAAHAGGFAFGALAGAAARWRR